MNKTSQPFQFYSQAHLRALTGLRAHNLKELLYHIKTVPGSVIYHHTHHFLQQHQFLSPEPPNDFAYWVTHDLNEIKLGEQLASIDISEFPTIRALREKIMEMIETSLAAAKGPLKEPNEGREFYFVRSLTFVFPASYSVSTLEEFVEALKKVTSSSLYFHIFEARLRHEKAANDFSLWLEEGLGETELAHKIARLDPYTYTMESLRKKVIGLVEERLGQPAAAPAEKGK